MEKAIKDTMTLIQNDKKFKEIMIELKRKKQMEKT